ncbi:hypothetical protein NP493_533g01030 [Ridgeia piscesae]|uniref:Medium-chain acyl-CoA ligase ACSF2, mitochondrial n=1 Tax=Ridgeia piscesae TaxID=27915 RepID=A0AAD9KWN3_RIDPI|nr:hypothetical protein NP493_533g01030 [Ridgeia piscesae]
MSVFLLGRFRSISGLQTRVGFMRTIRKVLPQNVASLSPCQSGNTYSTETPRGLRHEEKLKWSYVHGLASTPLIGVTIGQRLRDMAEAHPGREAMVFCRDDVRFTFEQLLTQADRLAAGLMSLGVKRGDRVGIWSHNCPEWILLQYATARAGMILVNVNPSYKADELEYALRKVDVKALVMAESFRKQDYYPILTEICPQLENCPANDLRCPNLPRLRSVITLSEKEFPGTLKFSNVLESGTNVYLQAVYDIQDKLQFDDPINIQFTSGTTGLPKGATLTHHNIVNNSRSIGHMLGYDKQESRICVPVPLYHCFGMVIGSLQCVTHGATCVFPCAGFEPSTTLTAVHEERCTSLYGTPTMFIDMLHVSNFTEFDLQSLNTGVMAGSPCPIEVMRQVIDKMHMPHITAKVISENGDVVPVGTPGNLCIRGYSVMLGYWGEAEKTKDCITPDGWYQTGDVVVLDEDGYGRIVGRLTDMINRGGENVYPVEVENVIYRHPGVADVQVIGVPDERFGEEVCAWVRLKDNVEATAEEIKQFCKGKVSHFKIPRYIRFVDEFPMTVTGKVQKFKMRNEEAKMLRSTSTNCK